MKLIVFTLLIISACTFHCSDVKRDYFEGKACNVVIEENKSTLRNIEIYGRNPENKEAVAFKDGGGIYIELIQSIGIGDTLQKDAQMDFFLLKKGLFVIKFKPKCINDEFLGISQDTLFRSMKRPHQK